MANAASLGGHNEWRTLTSGTGGEWEWILGPAGGYNGGNHLSSANPGTNCRRSSTVNGTANARFTIATVVSVAGMIIFPDIYTHPTGVTVPSYINSFGANYTVNNYNATDWAKMEAAGCVFLPAAGWRDGTTLKLLDANNSWGYYWSSSLSSVYATTNANCIMFGQLTNNTDLSTKGSTSRHRGLSVRLVREVQ